MRRDVSFHAANAELRAWLYVPDAPPPWPLVIMAHGFSATRGMTTDVYADRFRAAGLAVLLYDHRGFGDSDGEPRRQVNPWVQAREYIDAFAYALTLPEIDAARIALWGDSFSGGVALAVAGVEPRIAALVVQVPAIGSELPPDDPDGARAALRSPPSPERRARARRERAGAVSARAPPSGRARIRRREGPLNEKHAARMLLFTRSP